MTVIAGINQDTYVAVGGMKLVHFSLILAGVPLFGKLQGPTARLQY